QKNGACSPCCYPETPHDHHRHRPPAAAAHRRIHPGHLRFGRAAGQALRPVFLPQGQHAGLHHRSPGFPRPPRAVPGPGLRNLWHFARHAEVPPGLHRQAIPALPADRRPRRNAVFAVWRHEAEEHVRQAGARHRTQHVPGRPAGCPGSGMARRARSGARGRSSASRAKPGRLSAAFPGAFMPLPKPPARPGDLVETTARATPRQASPAAVPGPALDTSRSASRGRRTKSRPVAAILSKPATPAPKTAPVAAPAPVPAAAPAAPARTAKAPAADKPVPPPASPAPATAPAPTPRPSATRARPRRLPTAQRKLFVLDTNVLLHDPSSLFRFAEHDVFLPMIVLEELDHQKKGMSEVARNARQVSRYLDQLIGTADLSQGVPLDSLGNSEALGALYFQTRPTDTRLPLELPMGKADNVILGIVHGLRQENPKREIVLVSKDINMRLK